MKIKYSPAKKNPSKANAGHLIQKICYERFLRNILSTLSQLYVWPIISTRHSFMMLRQHLQPCIYILERSIENSFHHFPYYLAYKSDSAHLFGGYFWMLSYSTCIIFQRALLLSRVLQRHCHH